MIVSNTMYSNISVLDKSLFMEASGVALQLCKKINAIDLASIGISEYNQKYIQDNYLEPSGWAINALSISEAISTANKKISKTCLVDYGAGSGSICLLAKALGVTEVVYSDIYDLSCRDAKKLGDALGCPADQYLHGDLESVSGYLASKDLKCDVLVSNACIEHIYNIDDFFCQMQRLPCNKLGFWLGTGANPLRKKSRRDLSAVATKLEYEDRENTWGHKVRDSLESYLNLRKNIIRNFAAKLKPEEVEALGKKTRGLRQEDIEICLSKYLATGEMPPDPEHPTNTCDPHTGNWAERLMDPFELREKLFALGFQCRLKPMFWARDHQSALKSSLKALVNLFMLVFPTMGLKYSPGYILAGGKQPL
jgi:SAM-dependent methyltransferase